MRASRLLSLLILLQLKDRWTAEALAAEFEVSVRTIHRDIDELSAAGVPVYGDRGPGGGFRLREGFRTQLTGLLHDEAQSLPLLGLPGAARDLGLGSAPQRMRAKLLAALPRDAAALAGRLQEALHVDPQGWYQAPAAPPLLPALVHAVLERRRVRVAYTSWKGARRWVLEPLGLVQKAGDWYAVARQGTRTMTLRVAAIDGLEPLAETFERPAGFELGAWWQDSLARFERELRPLVARLRASAEGRRRLAERGAYAAHAVAPLAAEPGWAAFDLPVESPAQAARLVLSLAPEAEVLAPPALRAEVATLAAAAAARHRRTPAADAGESRGRRRTPRL